MPLLKAGKGKGSRQRSISLYVGEWCGWYRFGKRDFARFVDCYFITSREHGRKRQKKMENSNTNVGEEDRNKKKWERTTEGEGKAKKYPVKEIKKEK